jgi:hypothetical protein
MTTPALARRLEALEAAAPKTDLPRVIFIVGLRPGDAEPEPLWRVSVLDTILERGGEETEDAFRSRISAFVAASGRSMALAFEVSE